MQLYMKYFGMHVKSQMQHKLSFFFTLTGQFLASFATFLSLAFMFNRFSSVGGVSYEEVLIPFAVMLMAFSLGELFGRGFDAFPRMLGNGGFDRVLVRPRGVIFQVLADKMEFSRIGRLIQAVFVLWYALPRSGVMWTGDNIVVLLLMIICGSVLFVGIFVLYAAISFFTVEGLEVMNLLTNGAKEHGRLPFSIYGDTVLKFLTFVIPVALVQYYPLLYLIGRTDSLVYALAPVGSLVFLVPCFLFFRYGVSKYRSVGS